MVETAFELDDKGLVVMRPLLGWSIGSAAEIAVLVRLRYAQTQGDIGTAGESVQLAMTPQQALSLADVLTKQAQSILTLRPVGPGH